MSFNDLAKKEAAKKKASRAETPKPKLRTDDGRAAKAVNAGARPDKPKSPPARKNAPAEP